MIIVFVLAFCLFFSAGRDKNRKHGVKKDEEIAAVMFA